MKQPVERKLAAILAADVAGYSRLMGSDEEGTHERLTKAGVISLLMFLLFAAMPTLVTRIGCSRVGAIS